MTPRSTKPLVRRALVDTAVDEAIDRRRAESSAAAIHAYRIDVLRVLHERRDLLDDDERST